jgi:hypothetical protein
MAGTKARGNDERKQIALTASPESMLAATGTNDPAMAMARINEIAATMWLPEGEDGASLQVRVDNLFASLLESAPADALERMLAGQMIACHHGAMECFRRAMLPGQSFEGRNSNLKHAEKLSATYAKLLETLNKHRGKGQQKVTVEHVHVAAGGQAIVGNVDAGGVASESAKRRKVAQPQIAHQPAPPNPLDALDETPVARRARKKRTDG